MTWRDKTCEDCAFRVDRVCRRFPQPLNVHDNGRRFDVDRGFYDVKVTSTYLAACAEHATEVQQLTIKDVVR